MAVSLFSSGMSQNGVHSNKQGATWINVTI